MYKKGVTLLIVVIAISIMLILVTAASVVGSGAISAANYETYNSMLSRVTDDVNQYYNEKQQLPVTDEIVSSASLGKEFLGSVTANLDIDNKLFVVDMSKIEDSSVSKGKGTVANKDVFLVAENTHNVYYLKGYKYKGKISFSMQIADYSGEVNKASIDFLSFNNGTLNIRVSRGASMVKYAQGEHDVSYFGSNGTVVNNNSFGITDASQIYTVYVKTENNEEIVSKVSLPFIKTFANTSTGVAGSYQAFAIPANAKYKIEAYGAAGSSGNKGRNDIAPRGGKGAYVYGEFDLNKGDNLLMLVGQMGILSVPSNSSDDGTAGGGGGASFVTRIEQSENQYKVTAYTPNCYVTPLIIAAGGNGGNDLGRMGNTVVGSDGIYANGTSNTGFNKFLTAPNGTSFTNISQTSSGGYGGGTASDDYNGIGGGWQIGSATASNNTGSYSFNASTLQFGGDTGANAGQGKIVITKYTLDKID